MTCIRDRFILVTLCLVGTLFGGTVAAVETSSIDRRLSTTNLSLVGSPLFGPNLPFDATLRGDVLFGSSVQLAKSGSVLAVGAPKYDYATLSNTTVNVDGGAIFVYQLKQNEWDTANPLFFLPGESGEKLGDVFAINQDATRIFVRRSHQVPHAVQIYDLPTGNLVSSITCATEGQKQINGDAISINAFGNAIAMSCKTAKGSVEIYAENPQQQWMMVGELEGNTSDLFGFSTAFSASGRRLAIGSPSHAANSGLVQVFEFISLPPPSYGVWNQVGNDIIGESVSDQMGYAIDMSSDGTTLVVSSPSAGGSGDEEEAGSVSVFSFDSSNTIWSKIGTVFGQEAGDKFGRAVASCPDATCFVGTSWLHNQARGQSRLYQFQAGSIDEASECVEIAVVNGESRGDRLGQGRYSISLAMAGDRLQFAVGSTWTNNPYIDGNNAEKSVGQVQVFEVGNDDMTIDVDVDSMVPSIFSSESPTASPDIELSNSPSMASSFDVELSDAPSMTSSYVAMSDAPSMSSSEFDMPSMVPSSDDAQNTVIPSMEPTWEPTWAPISSETVTPATLGPLDWDLQRVGDISIRFSAAAAHEEIMFYYKAHQRAATLLVFEEDCKSPVPLDVIYPSLSTTSLSPTHNHLQVILDVNHSTIQNSPIFKKVDAETGLLALCSRVDLVTGPDANGTSVMFHEQKILVTLNLANSFTTATDLDRAEADTHVVEVDMEYTVVACQCNNLFECEHAEVDSGELVNICVWSTDGDSISISDIRSLKFTQGNFSHTTIESGMIVDAFSAVIFAPNGDSRLAVLQTFLVTTFFDREVSEEVIASGACSLSFLKGVRNLEAGPGSSQNREPVAFGVNLAISPPKSSSESMTTHLGFVYALGTWVAVLAACIAL